MTEKTVENKRVFFVSKYSQLSLTMRAEKYVVINGEAIRQESKRLAFNSVIRPRHLRGRAPMGSENPGYPDLNISVYWGIYSTDKTDELAFLRNHEYYRKTEQNNQLQYLPMLLELDFDPEVQDHSDTNLVKRRGDFEAPAEPTAPKAAIADHPRTKVGLIKR